MKSSLFEVDDEGDPMGRFFARVGAVLEWLVGDKDLVAARAEIDELGDDVTVAERTVLRAIGHGFSALRVGMAVLAVLLFIPLLMIVIELLPAWPKLQIACGAGMLPSMWLLSIRPRVQWQTAMLRAVIARVRRRERRLLDAVGSSSSSVAVPIGIRERKR